MSESLLDKMFVTAMIESKLFYVTVHVKTVKDAIEALNANKRYNESDSSSDLLLKVLEGIKNPDKVEFEYNKLRDLLFTYGDDYNLFRFIDSMRAIGINCQVHPEKMIDMLDRADKLITEYSQHVAEDE